ncbi:hypothetical protein AM593_02631, partial [Mytilus galloprovincialis]
MLVCMPELLNCALEIRDDRQRDVGKVSGEKTVQYHVHRHVLTNIVILQMGAVFGDVTLRTVLALKGVYLDEPDNIVINVDNLAYNQTANIFPVGQSNAGLSVDGLISTCIIFSSTATSSYLQVEFESLSAIITVHIVFGRDKTTADNNHAVYCSNTTNKWNSGTLLYSGLRLDTDIITFAVCNYLTYVPPNLSGNNMVELCEIEIGVTSWYR